MFLPKRTWLAALLLTALLIAACEADAPVTPASIPPTNTAVGPPAPTRPAPPSNTALPQSPGKTTPTGPARTAAPVRPTNTPAPTDTPAPTNTPAPTATPTPSIAGDPSLSGTLVLWHGWTGLEAAALDRSIADFGILYPNVKLEPLQIRVDQLQARFESEAATAGGGPDLLIGTIDSFGVYADAGLVFPLDDLLGDVKGNLLPGSTQALTYKGKLFGVPASIETLALFYNRRLARNPPATTDALLRTAPENGGYAFVADFYHNSGWLAAFGGRLFGDGSCAALDTEQARAFLDYLRQLKAAPGVTTEPGDQTLGPAFAAGEHGMIVNGSWAIADYRQGIGADLAARPLPAGPAGAAAPFLDVRPLMISANRTAEQQQLAATFARFYLSPENQAMLMHGANLVPSNLHVSAGDDPVMRGFIEQAKTAVPEPAIPEMPAVWEVMDRTILDVVEARKDAAQAARDGSAEIDERNGKSCPGGG